MSEPKTTQPATVPALESGPARPRRRRVPAGNPVGMVGTVDGRKAAGDARVPEEGSISKGKLLSALQVAGFLGCSVSYVYDLARTRQIPCGHVGKLVRFDPAAIERWWQLRQRAG